MIQRLLEKETSAHNLTVAYLITEKQKTLGAVHKMDKADRDTGKLFAAGRVPVFKGP